MSSPMARLAFAARFSGGLLAVLAGMAQALAGCAPQAAARPRPSLTPFSDRQVTVGVSPWQLPATLSVPVGAAPFAAVVLVHGSGPEDRDETLGQVKPFRDIAAYLASQGMAVLRYDKRTLVYKDAYAGDPALLARLTTREETTDDAEAAIDLLQRTSGVDGRRVFVLGHSMGGGLAPRILRDRPAVRGFISAEGFARPIQDVIVDQLEYGARQQPPLVTQAFLEQARAAADRVTRGDLPPDLAPAQWPFGLSPAYWADLRGYQPAQEAALLPQPALILQGENDYQVTMADFRVWKTALSGRRDASFHSYAHVDHLLISVSVASGPHDYDRPAHVAPAYLADLAGWIRAH